MLTALDDFYHAHELAQLYAGAVRELSDHWPGENGACLGCGNPYPCAEEWITMRAITGIEARWRREADRLREQCLGHDPAVANPADVKEWRQQ